MENLIIEGSAKTPTVELKSSGELLIGGRSIPENAVDFYRPLIDWIASYADEPQQNTQINIKLEYFNTSSSKCVLDIFKKLETLTRSEVVINWFYEADDDDMLEAGEDYKAILDVPFRIVEVEEL